MIAENGRITTPSVRKDGAKDTKIAVILKGCDAKAMYERAKRNQVNLDNIIMNGLNCGQCKELCAMDIPNSLIMHSLEMEKTFGFVPGVNMDLPVLAIVEEPTERRRLTDTGNDQIFNIFAQ